jgi:hypothetical protein
VTGRSASDPTSGSCVPACSKSSVSASSTTPPALVLESRCCNRRLNPQTQSAHSGSAIGQILIKKSGSGTWSTHGSM